jgi:hypothetical protein
MSFLAKIESPRKVSALGRKKRWHEMMICRFAKGTLARIDSALTKAGPSRPRERRPDFIREAVERELERRRKERRS